MATSFFSFSFFFFLVLCPFPARGRREWKRTGLRPTKRERERKRKKNPRSPGSLSFLLFHFLSRLRRGLRGALPSTWAPSPGGQKEMEKVRKMKRKPEVVIGLVPSFSFPFHSSPREECWGGSWLEWKGRKMKWTRATSGLWTSVKG